MAKKNATAPAATPVAPKSTKQTIPNIPCALRYYWQFATLAWGHCRANLARFAVKSPRFTEQYVDAELQFIEATKDLPTAPARNSFAKELLLELKAARQAVTDEAQVLTGAINYTFQDESVAAVQRAAAGLEAFGQASRSDWAAVSTFITTCDAYLRANITKLRDAGALTAEFATEFEALGLTFNTLWNNVVAKRQQAKDGTVAVADGILRIKRELDPMLALGSSIFKYEPTQRKLFTADYLVAQVRGSQPAGVNGRTVLNATAKPVAGVLVEVLNEGRATVTDAKGRYDIKQLAAGDYVLRFSGGGIEPLELPVTVQAGVSRRLNATLMPAIVRTARTAVAPPAAQPTLPDDDTLRDALSDVKLPVDTRELNGVH